MGPAAGYVAGMGTKIAETYLINVDSGANANKFYRAELHDDGTVVKNWGRVGATGQTKVEKGGRYAYEDVVAQKKRRGYTVVDVIGATASTKAAPSATLKRAATAQLTGGRADPVLADLIDRLVSVNKHQLLEASGGLISVNLAGQVTTPLGAISASSIRDARALLDKMSGMTRGADRGRLTEQYLRLIPQAVPVSAGRGWSEGWLDAHTSARRQSELLDSLEASVRYADASQATADESGRVPADLFRYRARVLDPTDADFRAVIDRYNDTKQDAHTWSKTLKPVRVYALEDARHGDEIAQTAKRVRNVRRLWHGTGAANVLSILAKGLFIPPTTGSGIHIAGRMFGDGIYLSRSASKSAGYSVGYWGGGKSQSVFMFLTETAMGSEYRPTGSAYDSSIPRRARTEKNKSGRPYDSINVNPGTGGVRNHEAVVWDPMQVNLRWLVEFEA